MLVKWIQCRLTKKKKKKEKTIIIINKICLDVSFSFYIKKMKN